MVQAIFSLQVQMQRWLYYRFTRYHKSHSSFESQIKTGAVKGDPCEFILMLSIYVYKLGRVRVQFQMKM